MKKIDSEQRWHGKLPLQIASPVTCHQSGGDEFEIVDGNGIVQITVRGRELARQIGGLVQWHLEAGFLY